MVWRNTKDAKHDGRDSRGEPHTTTRKNNTQVQKHNKMRAAPTPTCLHREQKVCRRMQTSSRQGWSHTPPPRAQVCYHVVPRRAHERTNEPPARATNREQKKQITFGQGVVVTGG